MTFSAKMLKTLQRAAGKHVEHAEQRAVLGREEGGKLRRVDARNGINVPIRYTTSAPSRNNRRLRISAKRVMSPKAAAALVVDVATSLKPRISARGFNGALGALGRGDNFVFDGERLGNFAGQK